MKVDHIYDHHHAVDLWSKRDLQEWLEDVFEAPEVKVRGGFTAEIRRHVENEFEKAGWAINVKIDQALGLSVFATKDDLAFQLQTGNVSRAAYDLLKLQYLYHSGQVQTTALALPTKTCATELGSNIANSERFTRELQLFDRVITVPILVLAFT